MTAYRHINVLLDYSTYLELRDMSKRIGRPYAEIVRESVRNTLADARKNKGSK